MKEQILTTAEEQKWVVRGKQVSKETKVCANCAGNMWNVLIYKYREHVKGKLPQDLRDRNDCWYGWECKT